MAYTTIDKSNDYFNTVLYSGDSTASNAITGVGFQPDWVWIKERNGTFNHVVQDSVRGIGTSSYLFLAPDNTDAETSQTDGDGLLSLDTDGFTVGFNNTGAWNESGQTYASWNWLADNTSGSSNTDGSITSTVSANTTSGFSIVSYTGTGANATVGHGLGVAPKMVIVKNRDTVTNWFVYHSGLTSATYYLNLNSNAAEQSAAIVWNSTAPTSSVFSVGASDSNTSGDDMIAYCFAEKKGFSKFGSYTGNGSSDGTFVYTGFKPAFVMFKITSSADHWVIKDNKRDPLNEMTKRIFPDLTNAEDTGAGGEMDFLSNGFKFRSGGTNLNNGSGQTYIYMAFAENPLVTSTGIPACAR